MEKLSRLYKIMYGSMDSLFVNRREESKQPKSQSKTIPTANGSKHNGYSSMAELSGSTPFTTNGVAPNPPPKSIPQIRTHPPSESRQWFADVMSTKSGADTVSCHSDSYSVGFKTVNVPSDFNHNQHPLSKQSQQRNPRLSPFNSRALSQSSQSLPMAVAQASNIPQKGSFSDLQALKNNNKKNKLNKHNNNNKSSGLSESQSRPSSSQLTTVPTELKITSVKDLIEVLIYQLQVMERRQAQMEVQSQNLERANKIYQQKLEIAARETELLKQKLALIETEVWRCYICSRDKVQLYSADIVVVSLICGHLLCAECSSVSRATCPKCDYQYTVDRRVHL